jgi:hypothetical protein
LIFSPLLIRLSGLSVLFSASFLLTPVAWLHYFARTRFIVKQFQLFPADHAKLDPYRATFSVLRETGGRPCLLSRRQEICVKNLHFKT